jgi:hypothetical protein
MIRIVFLILIFILFLILILFELPLTHSQAPICPA